MSTHMQHYGSTHSELRLVLLGNIGCGKTSSADTILSQLTDLSKTTPRSIQLRKDLAEGRMVTLVEAPRWYWNGLEMDEGVKKETERAMTLLAPGPHAVLMLVPVSQFTEMDGQVPTMLQQVFGKEILEHTIVLLTCGDYLIGRTVEEYLLKENPGLRQMIDLCGGRYHVINNRQRRDRTQVRELLDKVEGIVSKSGVFTLKTKEEREMDERVQQRKRELIASFRMQKEEKREALASTPNVDTLRSVESVESHRDAWERRREDVRDSINGGVFEVLQSSSTPEGGQSSRYDDQQERRSLRLSPDGARLSQMRAENISSNVVSHLHHTIHSVEENSPEDSPNSSPEPSAFYDPSTANFEPYPAPPPVILPSSPELRLVLIGRSGAGKSAAGNVILGRDEFESRPESLVAITQECVKKKGVVAGRRVAVVDTPDWFHSERTPDEVRAQISACVALSSPGPHAFLLCVPTDQPAKRELQSLYALETVFGPDVVGKHTLVLFTHSDLLRKSGKAGSDSVEGYLASQRDDLLKLVEKCGDRFHVLERGGRGGNVEELLEKVEQIAAEAGGQCYSSHAFQEAENRVREMQAEIARERRLQKQEEERLGEQFRGERRSLYPYMQTVAEAEEEVREEEVEKTRAEAERSVSNMNIESLPPITTVANMSPSMFQTMMEKVQSNAKMLPKLLSDSSVWVSDGAKKVMGSPAWGSVGSGAHNVQKTVAGSPVWGKVGTQAGHVSKMVGDRLPKVVVDGSTWVGSGAKVVADGSKRVGSGIGTGAKAVAQSPVWATVGSGAKSGAKLVADGSVRLGAGLGAGAKKVAQSPVWGKMGSGAKAGAKMVSESSVWQKMVANAKKVPMLVIAGALLGLALGVFLAGAIGGAAGAVVGSAVTEGGRRMFAKKSAPEKAASNMERRMNDRVDSLLRRGEKVMKTE